MANQTQQPRGAQQAQPGAMEYNASGKPVGIYHPHASPALHVVGIGMHPSGGSHMVPTMKQNRGKMTPPAIA